MNAPSSLPILNTARLHLRPLVADDAHALHRAYGDPEAMRFWDFAASRDIGETAKRLEWSLQAKPEWHAAWAVVLNESQSFIGMVNYHHRETWNRRLEIGFILERRYWRQRLMSEAVGALLEYCFDHLDAHRVEATIDPANVASRRLVERLGFKCESDAMRERMLVEGEFRDVLMHALLRPEWRAGQRP